jgi:hypothetical protein
MIQSELNAHNITNVAERLTQYVQGCSVDLSAMERHVWRWHSREMWGSEASDYEDSDDV